MADYDVVIIGAGVVGLAIATRLSEQFSVLVLEKNATYGQETSSRNSEVIHAGIYYPFDFLKTKLCIEGKQKIYELAIKHHIPYKQTGKIITLQDKSQEDRLIELHKHGLSNGVELNYLSKSELIKLEPHVNSEGGLFSPSSGIIDSHELMKFFYNQSAEQGADYYFKSDIVSIEYSQRQYSISIKENEDIVKVTSKILINSAGLNSYHIAKMMGIDTYELHYCKGTYYNITPSKSNLVSHLVYPLPTADSLGIHAILDLHGKLKFGPDVEYMSENLIDYTINENNKSSFLKSIQKILPVISESDIYPDYCGIRPKLQNKGEPPQDFVIKHEYQKGFEGLINLIGIESPGLTASPAIAEYVYKLILSIYN